MCKLGTEQLPNYILPFLTLTEGEISSVLGSVMAYRGENILTGLFQTR